MPSLVIILPEVAFMFETIYILGEIEGHDGGGSDKNTNMMK